MRYKQNGVVLIMTMVVLVMVTGLSVFALKRSILGERISKNMRSQSFAQQMAEGALHYCEDAVATNKNVISGNDFTINRLTETLASGGMPRMWIKKSNWITSGSGKTANIISASEVVLQDASSVPDPLCMVEEFALPIMSQDVTAGQPFLVTAIGYTSDYRVNSTGVPTSGAEVWLQSIVRP